MKIDDFNEAMNHIDPELIEEAGQAQGTGRKRISVWVRYGVPGIAAAGVVAVGLLWLAGQNGSEPEEITGDEISEPAKYETTPEQTVVADNEERVTVTQPAEETLEQMGTTAPEPTPAQTGVTYLAEAKPFEALSSQNRSALEWSDEEYQAQMVFTDKTAGLFYDANNEDGNFVYSPAGLYTGLAMLARCQDEVGASEVYQILGLNADDADAYVQKMMESITADEENSICRISNALWAGWYSWNDAASARFQTVADAYRADVLSVGDDCWYDEEALSKVVTAWISEHLQTEQDAFPIENQQSLLLLNTILFQKNWELPFYDSETQEYFTTQAGQEVSCEMMKVSLIHGSYLETERFTAAKIPYTDDSYLVVMLPAEGVDVQELLGSDLTNAVDTFRQGQEQSVDELMISMPKTDYTCNLNDMDVQLRILGLSSALTSEAFAGITKTGYENWVDNIWQDNHISFDEEGTSAESLTVISVKGIAGSILPDTTLELKLNRSYAYSVVTGNGTIVYVGVVGNPVS
jgi:serine protease inhibitor